MYCKFHVLVSYPSCLFVCFNLNAEADPLLERKGESRHSPEEQCSRVFQVPGCTKSENGLTMSGCVGDAHGWLRRVREVWGGFPSCS